MAEKSVLDWIAFVLVIIGAIDLGLVGLGFDLFEAVFGAVPTLLMIVQLLVGLAGLYLIYFLLKK